jgi:hypothetical protein
MDGEFVAEVTPLDAAEDSPEVEAASAEYLGRWNRLVSTTNWEKGRIIGEWRAALVEAGAPAASYTDEAWSRRVGNVTPQHAGRLRRVASRFGSKREAYAGLYWSHFQAALDWEDAEMWLEGAVHSGWSIAQMQNERAKTFGALAETSHENSSPEMDEDASPVDTDLPPEVLSGSMAEVHDTDDSEGQHAEDSAGAGQSAPFDEADRFADEDPAPVRPFEKIGPLPMDLQDAFEAFKLAIIHHRISNWQEVTCDDVIGVLDALRQLAEAPTQA